MHNPRAVGGNTAERASKRTAVRFVLAQTSAVIVIVVVVSQGAGDGDNVGDHLITANKNERTQVAANFERTASAALANTRAQQPGARGPTTARVANWTSFFPTTAGRFLAKLLD